MSCTGVKNGKPCRAECRLCEMFLAQRPPGLAANTPSCWPQKSDALAVHPGQIQAALDRNKLHGIAGVSYDPEDGRAILADRAARKQLMALEGCHDKSGGYGDDHAGTSPIYKEPAGGSDFVDL